MIETILTSAAVSATLTWLVQLWIGERVKNSIKHEYDSRLESHKVQLLATQVELETYKAGLAAANAAAGERLRAELHIAATERQIQFAKLHEKVAETVAELYARLRRVINAVADYIKIAEFGHDPPKKDRRHKVVEYMTALDDYFLPNRLYLPKSLASKVDSFYSELKTITIEFAVRVEEPPPDIKYSDRTTTWVKMFDKLSKEMPPLFSELEDEFQRLLGLQPKL